MNSTEFDTLSYPEDRLIDIGAGAGTTAAIRIKKWLKMKGTELNSDARMVGLGTGEAKPELELAAYFGIPDDNITLVDKQLHPEILQRLRGEHPGVNYQYGEGLYSFLQNTTEMYDLVTAFSLQHVLKDSERMKTFINLLSQKVRAGGIVCIYPYQGEDSRGEWIDSGFVPFYPDKPDEDVLYYTSTGMPDRS